MTEYFPSGRTQFHIPHALSKLDSRYILLSAELKCSENTSTQHILFSQPKSQCAVLLERTVDALLPADSASWEWTLCWNDCSAPYLGWQGARLVCSWVCLHFCDIFAWIPLCVSSLNGRMKTQHKLVSSSIVYSGEKRILFPYYLRRCRHKDDSSHRTAMTHF